MVILKPASGFAYSHRLLAVWWKWDLKFDDLQKEITLQHHFLDLIFMAASIDLSNINFCGSFNWFEQYYLLQGSFSYKLPADDALRGCQVASNVGDISQNSIMASTLLGSIIIFIPLARYLKTSCLIYCSGHLKKLVSIFIGCALVILRLCTFYLSCIFFFFSLVCELLTFEVWINR